MAERENKKGCDRNPHRWRRRARPESRHPRRNHPRAARGLPSDWHPSGWAGLVDIVREKDYDNSENFQTLSEDLVNRTGRTGGTFLHSSRTNPSKVKKVQRSGSPAV
jgi:hypothetical protein